MDWQIALVSLTLLEKDPNLYNPDGSGYSDNFVATKRATMTRG